MPSGFCHQFIAMFGTSVSSYIFIEHCVVIFSSTWFCLFHHVGVGNVVLQVASTVSCKECIGIEKAEIPSAYAQVRNQYIKIT